MHTDKKRIIIFTDWYLPGYRAGGPIRSLANLVAVLKHDFLIVTRNTDHHSATPYPEIASNIWLKLSDNVQVIYLDDDHLTSEMYQKILNDQPCDKIYFNSLFSPRFTLLPIRVARKMGLTKKCVLAPRGMLKSGALSIKSRKKKIFLIVAKLTGLFRGIRWHATSSEEEKEIKKHFPGAENIRVASNLSDVPMEKPSRPVKQRGELRLVCVARISPEKGILEALQFLKDTKFNGDVSCDFFGTQQNQSYLDECRAIGESIENVKIRFRGEIKPSDIPTMLFNYHFFYLTTLGENFGHAISEALTHATPVIISNLTPWLQLEEKKAGWDLPLESKYFVETLLRCCDMQQSEYSEWCDGAYKFGKKVALDHASIQASYAVFE